ncbi:MAG: hypothetical protein ABR915_04440 [Thermoguttaceae bacterium]|jgi:hypothetical protein
MNRIGRALSCFAVPLLVLMSVRAVWAAFQAKERLYELSWNGWQFVERDGRLGVSREAPRSRWFVAVPTIKSEPGLFVSGDPDGKEPFLRLVKEKNGQANWALELTQQWSPSSTRYEHRDYQVGMSGFRFKMKQAEGPFKDWHVAVGPPRAASQGEAEQAPAWRPLVLVKDASEAAEFEYKSVHYYIGHK